MAMPWQPEFYLEFNLRVKLVQLPSRNIPCECIQIGQSFVLEDGTGKKCAGKMET